MSCEYGNGIPYRHYGESGAERVHSSKVFGLMLADAGHQVAVLAISPSSTVTGGGSVGDKHDGRLGRHPNAFIRPSPSPRYTRAVHKNHVRRCCLCEAAGYDVILIETVGVGRSETVVRGMVDYFMLLVLTGAGDDARDEKGLWSLSDRMLSIKPTGMI